MQEIRSHRGFYDILRGERQNAEGGGREGGKEGGRVERVREEEEGE